MPARSNPASSAARLTMALRLFIRISVPGSGATESSAGLSPIVPEIEAAATWAAFDSELRPLLHAQFLHFLVVILPVEDVPLLRAFKNGAFLGLDLLAGGGIDSRFLHQQLLENLAGFLADGIGIFDELDLVHLLQDIRNGARQHVDFVAAQSHRTALYLRTSSVFTLRNISW